MAWALHPGCRVLRLLVGGLLVQLSATANKFTCVTGRPCTEMGPLYASNLTSTGSLRVMKRCADSDPDIRMEEDIVELSPLDPEGIAQFNLSSDGLSLTFGFSGNMELADALDSYLLCWCQPDAHTNETCSNTSGFRTRLGSLQVDGVQAGTFAKCFLGQVCTLERIMGVNLQPNDRLTAQVECSQWNADFLEGLPGTGILETSGFRSFDFIPTLEQRGDSGFRPVLHAAAGIYRLCFCRPVPPGAGGSCTAPGDFVAPAGYLFVAGPHDAQTFTCTLGSACSISNYRGVRLAAGDKLMVRRKCVNTTLGSSGVPRISTAAGEQGGEHDLGVWPLEGLEPGLYELCWCASGFRCQSAGDFAALGGRLSLKCPSGYFINGTTCGLCAADHYCSAIGDTDSIRCPSLSGTNGVLGAEDPSACLCRPGTFAASGAGTVELDCRLCPEGTFAYRFGETACHSRDFTCTVGWPCQGLGPVAGRGLSPDGSLRVAQYCGTAHVVLTRSSPLGEASVRLTANASFFGFGSAPVEAVSLSGTYALCWCERLRPTDCQDDAEFLTDLAHLRVEGPISSTWRCTLGKECVIDSVDGVGVRSGDRLIASYYSCGVADDLPLGMPGIGIAETDGTGVFTFLESGSGTSSAVIAAEPGIYRLCFCRLGGPDGLHCNSTADFRAHMGYLEAEGPALHQLPFECILGSQCSITGLIGVGLNVGDSLAIAESCGNKTCWGGVCGLRFNASSSSDSYDLGTLSHSLPPGDVKLCWCSALDNCSQDSDFMIETTTLTLECPDNETIVSGACTECCTTCFMVSWTIENPEARSSQRICKLGTTHLASFMVLVVVLPKLMLVVSLFCRATIPVQDIGRDEEATVVTTSHLHLVLKWARPPVVFRNTCVPWLDFPKERYVAEVINGYEFRLLDAQGCNVEMPCDASRGEVWIPFPYSAAFCGILRVPLAVLATFFLAMVITSIVVGRLMAIEIVVITAVWILGFALFHVDRRRRDRQTPLATTCQAYRKRLLAQRPKPQACPRGASRALRVEQLLDLYNFFQGFIKGRNMYYVCPNIVKPLTRPERLSFAEFAGPSEVDWFVSHFWGMPFKDSIASVQRHAQTVASIDWKKVSYWICTLSNNQWKVEDEVGHGDWQESSFYKALRSGLCQGTAMVLDDQALPLTRSWCLFEVLQTSLLARDDKHFAGLLLCTPSGVLNYGTASMDVATSLARRLASLRLQDASASNLEDKQMIDRLVESMPGGFDAMNGFMRDRIRRCLLTMKDHFDGELHSICKHLEAKSADSEHDSPGDDCSRATLATRGERDDQVVLSPEQDILPGVATATDEEMR